MRLRDHEMPLDPDVERELEAVDHALRGLRVASDLEELRDLAVDARADRPGLEPDFGTKLDQWAAAGFPRDGRPGARASEETGSAVSGPLERLRSVPPRRLLLSMGAAATLVVAVGVGIGVSDQLGGKGGGGEAGISALTTAAPSSGPGSSTVESAPSQHTKAGGNGGPAGDAAFGRLSTAQRSAAQSPTILGLNRPAGRAAHRKVAQNVDLVLVTEPQKVRDVADDVVAVVDKNNGYVVSSNVTSGRGSPTPVPLERGDTGRRVEGTGTFRLRIPASKLRGAVSEMSDLAHVASRTDGTIDITNRFDAAQARIQDLETQRQHLLRQLADAFTIEEQDSLNARLKILENQLADTKGHLGHIQTRIRLVPVTVEIRGQEGVDSGGGAWSIGDAFHDAGRVLTVIAGILLISAAVLVPLGLIGAVAWITARAMIRRRREGALE